MFISSSELMIHLMRPDFDSPCEMQLPFGASRRWKMWSRLRRALKTTSEQRQIVDHIARVSGRIVH